MRRNVGRIGFHHQGRQRHRPHHPAHLLRPLEGGGAADAQFQPQRDETFGLLLAAVERMGDAAPLVTAHPGAARLAQVPEHPVGRPAHMQQHRQVEAARQAQLFAKEPLLAGVVQGRVEIVQPDLADGHQPGIVAARFQLGFQRRQVFVGGAAGKQRVDAQRIGVAVPAGPGRHRAEVDDTDSRHHTQGHPASACGLAHGRTVGGEFGGVEVAVGVDPGVHDTMMPQQLKSTCCNSSTGAHWLTNRATV